DESTACVRSLSLLPLSQKGMSSLRSLATDGFGVGIALAPPLSAEGLIPAPGADAFRGEIGRTTTVSHSLSARQSLSWPSVNSRSWLSQSSLLQPHALFKIAQFVLFTVN